MVSAPLPITLERDQRGCLIIVLHAGRSITKEAIYKSGTGPVHGACAVGCTTLSSVAFTAQTDNICSSSLQLPQPRQVPLAWYGQNAAEQNQVAQVNMDDLSTPTQPLPLSLSSPAHTHTHYTHTRARARAPPPPPPPPTDTHTFQSCHSLQA